MNGLFHCSIPLYWYRFTVVDGGIASCNISQHQVLNPVVEFMLKKEKMGPTKQLLWIVFLHDYKWNKLVHIWITFNTLFYVIEPTVFTTIIYSLGCFQQQKNIFLKRINQSIMTHWLYEGEVQFYIYCYMFSSYFITLLYLNNA